jgi:TolB protein
MKTDARRLLTIVGAVAVLVLLTPASGRGRTADQGGKFQLESAVAFSSTRDHVNDVPALTPPFLGAEIYLARPDFADPDPANWSLTNLRRLTNDESADGFATLSPDGKKIVFDSTRLTGCLTCPYPATVNRSDLFVMSADGAEQELLRPGGSSATWAPDTPALRGHWIAFHASASGSGTPLRTDPGSATSDSDIFVANVDNLLEGVEPATNITRSWTESGPNGTRLKIADDPDWSPDGEHIAFTAHDVGDEGPNWPLPPFRSTTAEIFVIAADGSGTPQRLTHNFEEERGPAWSPDGSRIAFACRAGTGNAEICVMNADGSHLQQLTNNTVADLTPTWSLDGQQLVFHRAVVFTVDGVQRRAQELHVLNVPTDPGVCDYNTAPCNLPGQPLTAPPAVNNLANWGEVRVKVR